MKQLRVPFNGARHFAGVQLKVPVAPRTIIECRNHRVKIVRGSVTCSFPSPQPSPSGRGAGGEGPRTGIISPCYSHAP